MGYSHDNKSGVILKLSNSISTTSSINFFVCVGCANIAAINFVYGSTKPRRDESTFSVPTIFIIPDPVIASGNFNDIPIIDFDLKYLFDKVLYVFLPVLPQIVFASNCSSVALIICLLKSVRIVVILVFFTANISTGESKSSLPSISNAEAILCKAVFLTSVVKESD